MNRVAEINPVAGGYELLLTGNPAEARALAEAFIRQEASCCSFLHFELNDTPEGLRVKLTSSPAGVEFAKGAFSQAGTNVKWAN